MSVIADERDGQRHMAIVDAEMGALRQHDVRQPARSPLESHRKPKQESDRDRQVGQRRTTMV